MKKRLIALIITCALTLTACSKGGETNPPLATPQESTAADTNQDTAPNSEETGGGETSSDTPTSAETTESPEEEAPPETFLIGPDGKAVSLSDIVLLTDKEGNELAKDDLTEESFGEAVCEGFCYLAEPKGLAQNAIDNKDTFVNPMSNGLHEIFYDYDFKRYNVGDKFGELTVKSASVEFNSMWYDASVDSNSVWYDAGEERIPEIFYSRQRIEFEGEVTLTGYITVLDESDYFPENEGLMEFLIDDKSSVLPLHNQEYSSEGLFTYSYSENMGVTYLDNLMYSVDEYGKICLGYIDSAAADMTGVDIGSDRYSKAEVTIYNIVMGEPKSFYAINAEIKDIKIIEQY